MNDKVFMKPSEFNSIVATVAGHRGYTALGKMIGKSPAAMCRWGNGQTLISKKDAIFFRLIRYCYERGVSWQDFANAPNARDIM